VTIYSTGTDNIVSVGIVFSLFTSNHVVVMVTPTCGDWNRQGHRGNVSSNYELFLIRQILIFRLGQTDRRLSCAALSAISSLHIRRGGRGGGVYFPRGSTRNNQSWDRYHCYT